MKSSVVGRVNNIPLSTSKPLQPLFESIVNSIDAVEERNINKGEIKIYISNDDSINNNDLKGRINGFKIVDNGIGFNQINFESFETSDSIYKIQKGAKGIGRFLWLKAFKNIQIQSVFQENETWYKRTFNFELKDDGIINHKCIELKNVREFSTEVLLSGFKDEYKNNCPQNIEIIAKRIIEHYLIFFMNENGPIITMYDSENTIVLNDLYNQTIKKEEKEDFFKIKNKEFCLKYFKLYNTEENDHKIHYCANHRKVSDENIKKFIPDIKNKLPDENGNKFILSIYVTGKYFDEKVNQERTSILFSEDNEIFDDVITESELQNEVINRIKTYIEPFIQPIRKEKYERFNEYVQTKQPRYRAAVKYGGELIDKIPPDISEKNLNIELAKVDFDLTQNLSKESEKLKKDIENISNFEEYKKRFIEYINKYDDFGKSKLAEYIAHRKVILEFLEKGLQQNDDGKFQKESYIHNIICPMRSNSDDILFEDMNLWIIDERLSYHTFLASDLPLKKMKNINNNGLERPDITIFNSINSFTDDDSPYNAIVIVEFKRPLRDDYNDDPIDQLYEYIKKLNNGEVSKKGNRPIPKNENRRYFCYLICDITSKIHDFAKKGGFRKTPDGNGYFSYNENYSAYIEILSFDKLLQDAYKRNKILFEKLNI